MPNIVSYLNKLQDFGLSGSLVGAIESLPAKMRRAPAKEWEGAMKGLVSRGLVKQSEIDDLDISGWMVSKKGPIEREDLVEAIQKRSITIKEVQIGSPMYQRYSHAPFEPSSRYAELLYIANSQRDNVEDRIEEVEWALEDFNLDIERLSESPEELIALTDERACLMKTRLVSHDFAWSHFVRQDLGREGKNLIVHARELRFGCNFLVEEIQSDWGQLGRCCDWQGVPKGPFVTDTKLWAGLAMRRMMQRAAMDPAVERFYWIRGSMRNGGVQVTKDKLDEFYLKTMSGIVDRVISPAGQKCRLETLHVGSHLLADVPCFDMTPEVREHLRKGQPMYSLAQLLPKPAPVNSEKVQFMMGRASAMTGSPRSIRLVDHLYDVSIGKEVAGNYINGLIQASLRAADLQGVLDHECFHFGMEKLFTEAERRMITRSFAPGSHLSDRVVQLLRQQGDHRAALQCVDPEEAAAHAFALWGSGKMELNGSPERSLFSELRVLVGDVMSWIRRIALDEKIDTPKALFESFSRGNYAGYAKNESVYVAPAVHRAEVDRVRP